VTAQTTVSTTTGPTTNSKSNSATSSSSTMSTSSTPTQISKQSKAYTTTPTKAALVIFRTIYMIKKRHLNCVLLITDRLYPTAHQAARKMYMTLLYIKYKKCI